MFTSLLPSWQPQRNFIVCSIRQRRTSAHLCSSRTSIAFHIVFSWFFFSFRQTIFPKATVILWPFTLGLLRVKYSSGRLCLDDWPIYAENDLIERSEKNYYWINTDLWPRISIGTKRGTAKIKSKIKCMQHAVPSLSYRSVPTVAPSNKHIWWNDKRKAIFLLDSCVEINEFIRYKWDNYETHKQMRWDRNYWWWPRDQQENNEP